MILPEKINTVAEQTDFTFKEKGSVFIAKLFHTETKTDVDDILQKIKKEYYDATHHCHAYFLIDGSFKYSDDGEPNGTAGVRIYNAIEHFNLVNVLVVVIRYFGGTKLGVGPLGKAYYSAAFGVLNKASRVVKFLYEKIEIKADFKNISNVHRILNNFDTKMINTNYSEKVNFEYLVKPRDLGLIQSKLNEISRGEVKIVTTGTTYYK